MSSQLYLVALGSNQRHTQLGSPREVVRTAMGLLDQTLGNVLACSPIMNSAPVGPSMRRYANAALVIETDLLPREMLTALQSTENSLGRIHRGRRWRSRIIDLDIILWSGGTFSDSDLTIPHKLFRERDFVLGPATTIAPVWRDPITGYSLRQLYGRLTRNRPIPR